MEKEPRKNRIISVVISLLFIIILGVLVYPFYKEFTAGEIPQGIDYYQIVSVVTHLDRFFTFPTFMWAYFWYLGFPLFYFYGIFHLIVILPFVWLSGILGGIEIYIFFSLFIYILFSYLLFKEISKSNLLAFGLSVAVLFSLNLYNALFVGGNMFFTVSQMFLPMVIYLLFKFIRKENYKYLIIAALAMGLSLWGHVMVSVFFIWPFSLFLLLFYRGEKNKISILKKIKDTFVFFLISIGIGLAQLYALFKYIFSVTLPGLAEKNLLPSPAVQETFTTTNITLWLALALVFMVALVSKKIKSKKLVLPLMVVLIYFFLFELSYNFAKMPFGDPLGSPRTYWAPTLAIACLVAAFWDGGFKKEQKNKFISLNNIIILVVALGLLISPYFTYNQISSLGEETTAYPAEVRGAFSRQIKKEELVPSWLDPDEMNYRLSTEDANVNMWWTGLFKMPIVRGYYNVLAAGIPSGEYLNHRIVWLGTALPGYLPEQVGISKEQEKNTISFLLDWFGIKYLEGSTKEETPERAYAYSLPAYLQQDETLIRRSEFVNGLKFLETSPGVTSPIVGATNAPTLGVVAEEAYYDTFFRDLALLNLNSQNIIPLFLGGNLSVLNRENLSDFDAILVYGYQGGSSKTWEKLEEYVREGGRLFIETGGDTPESEKENLPSVFPVSTTKRANLGEAWQIEYFSPDYLTKSDISNFSELKYGDSPWNFSHAVENGVRSWAETILSQRGYPVLVEGNLEKGKVIWSGINLPYHFISYNNQYEGNLMADLFGSLVDLNSESESAEVVRPNPENVEVKGQDSTGILFKEHDGAGWQARLVSPENMSLKIYRAGPDFMYVRLPEEAFSSFSVKFSYRGSFLAWTFLAIFCIIIVLIIDYLFLRKRLKTLFSGLLKKTNIKKWWESEE